MEMQVRISFTVQPFEGAAAVMPFVDGTSLAELISAFEREHNFEPAGGYGGLIPEWFKYGALDRYFLGHFEKDSYFARLERVYVLGCQCGEVGCWPLLARISVGNASVMWDSFQQPHRKERDYSGFGPMVFDAQQYCDAVAALRSVRL